MKTLLLYSVFAQNLIQSDTAPVAVNYPPMSTTGEIPLKSDFELYLSIGVLVFGLMVFIIQIIFFITSKKNNYSQPDKLLTVNLIIIAAVFLVTAGYSNEQIAPIIGLMGTIAGYVIGRQSNKESNND